MSTFQLSVVSPDGKLYSGDVFALYVRGSDGDLAVLAGHAPLVTAVQPGVCRIELEDGDEKSFKCEGGLLNVGKSGVSLLDVYKRQSSFFVSPFLNVLRNYSIRA